MRSIRARVRLSGGFDWGYALLGCTIPILSLSFDVCHIVCGGFLDEGCCCWVVCVSICPRCGRLAVWVPGLQVPSRKCTCSCHRDVVVDGGGFVDEEG